MKPLAMLEDLAPQVGLEPTTLRLTAVEFANPPAAINYYKPLYMIRLRAGQVSKIAIRAAGIVPDFEGAWAQKWAQ